MFKPTLARLTHPFTRDRLPETIFSIVYYGTILVAWVFTMKALLPWIASVTTQLAK